MKKIIWIDTETTGLDATTAGLTEVACIIEIDGVEKEKILMHIDPSTYNREVTIDEKALATTGKTMDDLSGYGDSGCYFDNFIETLDKYVDKFDKNDNFKINGYNTKFDVAFIKEWFTDNDNKYYGSYFDYKELDVFALVGYIKHLGFIDTKDEKLKTVCEHFGIELDAHKAFDDITATKRLGELLSERFINNNTQDRLAELEELIREWFIAKGMATNSDCWFEIAITTRYKSKNLHIYDTRGWAQYDLLKRFVGLTTKEMFDAAFEFFKIKV